MSLTPQERDLLDLSADLYNGFAALPEEHPSDAQEFVHHMHALQRIIMARPAHRELRQLEPEGDG